VNIRERKKYPSTTIHQTHLQVYWSLDSIREPSQGDFTERSILARTWS
jgi:hypothetical protein